MSKPATKFKSCSAKPYVPVRAHEDQIDSVTTKDRGNESFFSNFIFGALCRSITEDCHGQALFPNKTTLDENTVNWY